MRILVLSLMLTTATVAQPPQPPKPAPPPPNAESFLYALQGAEKPPAKGSVEEAILTAQRHHPDIRLAEAKRQMADAEVEQAKFLVAQRVAAAFAKIEQAKEAVQLAKESLAVAMKAAGSGVASDAEVRAARVGLLRVSSELMAAELELKAATGAAARGPSAAADPNHDASVAAGLKWLARSQFVEAATAKSAPAGTVADKLKAILDKPVKLDLKGADLDEALAAVLKAAGEASLTVKLPTIGKKYLKVPPTATFAGEVTFTAAVQLVMDEMNNRDNSGGIPDNMKGHFDVYVREYGLFIARTEDAPKDALTLTEFARQVRAAKGERK